jgi:Mn-dependent DtxR family transcriptional regulator
MLKVENMEQKTIGLLKEYGKPASVGFVAEKLELCWASAQAVLLKMSLSGKINYLETSKGILFCAKN